MRTPQKREKWLKMFTHYAPLHWLSGHTDSRKMQLPQQLRIGFSKPTEVSQASLQTENEQPLSWYMYDLDLKAHYKRISGAGGISKMLNPNCRLRYALQYERAEPGNLERYKLNKDSNTMESSEWWTMFCTVLMKCSLNPLPSSEVSEGEGTQHLLLESLLVVAIRWKKN